MLRSSREREKERKRKKIVCIKSDLPKDVMPRKLERAGLKGHSPFPLIPECHHDFHDSPVPCLFTSALSMMRYGRGMPYGQREIIE